MLSSSLAAVTLCSLVAVSTVNLSAAQSLNNQIDNGDGTGGWDSLGGLYALLAQHDALGGHALARKSVRSPSRRLRFGRRSDPNLAPQPPMDELDELLSLRDVRTPMRLRFGRSEERAVPHVFPQEEQERLVRTPSMRLRFGRRADNSLLLPYETKDAKPSDVEDGRQQD